MRHALWEGTDGGGRQLRQAELLLCFLALIEGRRALNLAFRQLRDALLHGGVVDALGLGAGANCAVADAVGLFGCLGTLD